MDFFTKIHRMRILLRLVPGLYWAFSEVKAFAVRSLCYVMIVCTSLLLVSPCLQ